MKAPWIAVLIAVLLGAAATSAIWKQDAGKIAALQKQVADLTAANAKLTADLADANDRAQSLASESAQLREVHDQEQAAAAIPQPVASATPEKPKSKGVNFFTQMMKDPQMRKMIAAQQATAMRGMYRDFIKQNNLDADKSEQFYKLLQDRMAAQMDRSSELLGGGKVEDDGSNGASTSISVDVAVPDGSTPATTGTDAMSASNDALKDLLGADGYAAFQSYEKSLPSRIAVQQFGQQLTGDGMALQDTQNTALTQIMSQEQAAMPSFTGANGTSQLMNMTDTQVDQFEQQQQATDQRIYDRAASVLTPQQLSAFQTYQKNMESMQAAGLKMTKQMFNSTQ